MRRRRRRGVRLLPALGGRGGGGLTWKLDDEDLEDDDDEEEEARCRDCLAAVRATMPATASFDSTSLHTQPTHHTHVHPHHHRPSVAAAAAASPCGPLGGASLPTIVRRWRARGSGRLGPAPGSPRRARTSRTASGAGHRSPCIMTHHPHTAPRQGLHPTRPQLLLAGQVVCGRW